MPSVFFQIGAVDLTPWEDIQNHAVNKDPVFETWTDGNWITHRVVARTRVAGSLTLGFYKAADFAAFRAALAAAQDPEGFYPVTVYCANTGTTETVDAFLDLAGADKWDLANGRQWQTVAVQIEER